MIFDGATHRIILDASDGDQVDVADAYSRWIDWVHSGDGMPFAPAFLDSDDGAPLGSGLFAGVNYFLNNAIWRIRPREANHELSISGNLFRGAPDLPLFAPTLGVYQVATRLASSSLTQAIVTSGTDPASVATAVWGHATAVQLVAAVTLVKRITDNRLEIDIAGQRLVLYDDAGTSVLRTWPLATTGSEPVTAVPGVQAKRGTPT